MKNEFLSLPPEEQTAVLEAAREINRPVIRKPSLHAVSMTELFDMSFPPRTPVIEGLLYSGTYLFAGSPKIGKSFFMSQLGYHVATGKELWGYPVRKGSVLYLALEDDFGRLQGRLNTMFGVETVDGLFFATQARTLTDGLNGQLEEFVQLNPDTRLIIVDTLQKVRELGNESYSYSMDYQNITALKAFSDAHNLAIIVVHHTRKLEASDSFDMISGTNGLLGAADGAFILQKKKRTDPTAVMQVVGRDQPDQELTLEFSQENCVWELTKAARPLVHREPEPLIQKIAAFMADKETGTGTASELLEAIQCDDIKAHILSRKLNVGVSVLFNDCGIIYTVNRRSSDRKTFTLRSIAGREIQEEDDGSQMTHTGCENTVIASLPSGTEYKQGG